MIDAEIREQAFLWLREQAIRSDYVIPRTALTGGFVVDGSTVNLVGASGIWKPRVCELPISITSVSNGPYDDSFSDDGLLYYRYRGDDPNHRDNVGLRELMRTRTPLIYFHGVMPGKYVPVWPVFIVNDMSEQLACRVAVDPAYAMPGIAGAETEGIPGEEAPFADDSSVGVRRYVATFTMRRLHQTSFRERVIVAYAHTCILCRLQHASLLDAAHIIPDSVPGGDPVVNNGLCLCKIHHAAYDQNILGIAPDYRVHVRRDILAETDGPMLRHGLQEVNGQKIVLPAHRRDYPDPNRLNRRFSDFLSA